jgi:Spy/CpxP family protein refolding chaperone
MRYMNVSAQIVLTGLMVLATTLAAGAQQTGSAAGRGQRGERRERPELTEKQRQEMAERRAAHLQETMAELGLTEAQKVQFAALQASFQAKMEAQRKPGERPDREAMAAARTEYETALAQVLTAEQLAKYQQMRPQRGRRGPGQGPGQGGEAPPPPPDGAGE